MKEYVMRINNLLGAVVAITTLAGTASAHSKLVSAVPATNATVASPKNIDLHFSEQLKSAFSKGELVMAVMPGMDAMKMASSVSLGADGKTSPPFFPAFFRKLLEWARSSRPITKRALWSSHSSYSVR